MMTSVIGSFLLLLLGCVTGMEDRTIMVNDIMGLSTFHHSRFKPALICPMGKAVTGFRVKMEQATDTDKAGLTGIELMCQDGTKLGPVASELGKWREWKHCAKPNIVTGFNYRSENANHKIRGRDYRGGTQIKMECSNGVILGPEGVNVGEWYQPNYSGCPATATFCGFAAEFEANRGRNDDTALNRMKFMCCTPSKKLPAHGEWTPLGKDICIGSKNSNYGFIRMPKSGLLSGVKFLYLHGSLMCNIHHPGSESNFGCNYHQLKGAFGILVTTSENDKILPDHNPTTAIYNRRYYTIIGKDARVAKNFTLLAANPWYINKNVEIRFWYGDDLYERRNSNNGDRKVCVNIYGKFYE